MNESPLSRVLPSRVLRGAVVAAGIACAIVALGLARREPWATALWPWPDHRLTFWFAAAKTAATAAALVWLGASASWRAGAPVALDVAVTSAGMAGYLARGMPVPGLNHATILALLALIGGVLFVAAQRAALPGGPPAPPPMPLRMPQPLQPLLRAALAAFALVLAAAGAALVAGVPQVMPWPLQRGSAILVGWGAIGSACLVAWPLVQRRSSAMLVAPPLWSLFAHGLVLGPPLAAHLGAVRPEYRASLVVCLTVLAAGMAVAAWALFMHRPMRQAWTAWLGSRT